MSSEGREVVEEVEEVDGREKVKKVSKLWDVELCQVCELLDMISVIMIFVTTRLVEAMVCTRGATRWEEKANFLKRAQSVKTLSTPAETVVERVQP